MALDVSNIHQILQVSIEIPFFWILQNTHVQNSRIMIPTCYIYIGYEKQRRNTALCWNTCAVCSDDPVTTTTTLRAKKKRTKMKQE